MSHLDDLGTCNTTTTNVNTAYGVDRSKVLDKTRSEQAVTIFNIFFVFSCSCLPGAVCSATPFRFPVSSLRTPKLWKNTNKTIMYVPPQKLSRISKQAKMYTQANLWQWLLTRYLDTLLAVVVHTTAWVSLACMSAISTGPTHVLWCIPTTITTIIKGFHTPSHQRRAHSLLGLVDITPDLHHIHVFVPNVVYIQSLTALLCTNCLAMMIDNSPLST